MDEKEKVYEVTGTATVTVKFKDLTFANQENLMEMVEARLIDGCIDSAEITSVDYIEEINILNKWAE